MDLHRTMHSCWAQIQFFRFSTTTASLPHWLKFLARKEGVPAFGAGNQQSTLVNGFRFIAELADVPMRAIARSVAFATPRASGRSQRCRSRLLANNAPYMLSFRLGRSELQRSFGSRFSTVSVLQFRSTDVFLSTVLYSIALFRNTAWTATNCASPACLLTRV